MVFVNFTYTMKTRFQQHMTKVIRTVLVYFSVIGVVACSPCGQDMLSRCSQPLKVFSENKDLTFAAKKEELDLICPDLNEGLSCIDEYTRSCMSPHQRSHFNRLYAGSSMVIQEICQEGPYQEEFLRHAPCMKEVKEDYEICAREYEQKIHSMQAIGNQNTSSPEDGNDQVRKLCCSFQEYLRCSHAIVMGTCGEETAQFTKAFLDRMASSLIQIHCEKYPPGSQICDDDYGAASHLPRLPFSYVVALSLAVFLLRT